MAISTELMRDTKVKLHLLLTQKESRSSGEELLLKTLGDDCDVLESAKERREAWTLLSKSMPDSVADVFDQA